MKSRRVASFAEEGKWTSGADSTMLIGDWQAWVDGDGHWKVRGPNPDDEAHYAGGDIELTEAEYIEAGNSAARRKIRARRAKEAARAYIKTMTQTSKRQHATKKSPAQLQREIDDALAKPKAGTVPKAGAYKKTSKTLIIEGEPWTVRRDSYWSPSIGGGVQGSAWIFTRVSDGRTMTSSLKDKGIRIIGERIKSGEFAGPMRYSMPGKP